MRLFGRRKRDEEDAGDLLDVLDAVDPDTVLIAETDTQRKRRGLFGRREKADDDPAPEVEDLLVGIEIGDDDTLVGPPEPAPRTRFSERIGSILAVDFGSVNTRCILIDLVEGRYRLVGRGESRTSDGFPAYDLDAGFHQAIREMEAATGRKILTDNGQLIRPEQSDRSGVDAFGMTASIGRPLRAVIIGLTPDVSVATALRTAAGTYVEVLATLNLADGRSEEERLNAVLLSYPDVLIITGGTEQGARDAVLRLAEIARLAVSLTSPDNRPTVIYSGNHANADDIQALFDDLTTVLIAENVRPSLQEERLDSARLQLGKAFDYYNEIRSESFAAIGSMSDSGVQPTAQSYTVMAEYLGKTHAGGVALVDAGSTTNVLAVASGGQLTSSIRTDLGIGHSARQLVEIVGEDRVARWLPFYLQPGELENYAINKSLRPFTVPSTLRDLYLDHALLRAGIRNALLRANPDWEDEPLALEMLIGAGGGLTRTGHPAYDTLLMLDSIQPSGVTRLQSDPYGMIAAMGALALRGPHIVVQLLEGGSLNMLGTAVSLQGRPRLDKPAMQVEIMLAGQKQAIKQTVMGGHLWVYKLPPGKTAQISVKCQSGTSINGQRSVKLTVVGGQAGLIFDARGRPLPLMVDVVNRAQQLPLWVHEVTGDPIQEIAESWLAEPEMQEQKPSRVERKPKRSRGRRRKKQEATADDELDELLQGLDRDEDEIDELRNVLS
jgi:hypothetical protein